MGSVVALAAGTAEAHGFGQRYDLPVPLWLWAAGAAAAVALSFVVIAVFVEGGGGRTGYRRINLLDWPVGRALAHPGVTGAARVAAVLLTLLVVAGGVVGSQNPTRNLAPTVIWVLWWVGLAYVSALLGDLWALVNPWKTVFGWVEALYRRGDPEDTLALALPYPARLGVWPAVALYLAFAWVELVYPGRAEPRQLALLAGVYSVLTWTGMFLFGRTVWLRQGDPFALVFGVLARFAPTEIRVTDPGVCAGCPVACREPGGDCVDCDDCFGRAPAASREWNLRPLGAGLLRPQPVSPSLAVLVVLLLASVTYDGLTATPLWAGVESWLYGRLPELGGLRLVLIGTAGLLTVPSLFLACYGLFAWAMAAAVGEGGAARRLARAFVLSLVPISIAYHLAHYLTYLLIQGQLAIRLASDPFGLGWNLLGTAGYAPDIAIVGARFAWYTAVAAIVLGHVIAVYVAHVIALREFPERHRALRSQYPMLALMVGYTVVSLWIIAQPIVETGGAG